MRKDFKKGGKGGGFAIYVHDIIKSDVIHSPTIEAIHLHVSCMDFLLFSVFNLPDGETHVFLD